jgi:tryptophan synthase beta subunit
VTQQTLDLVNDRVKDAYKFVTDDILDLAEKITLAELLECKPCLSETLSLLSNVARFHAAFERSEKDQDVLNRLMEVHNLFPKAANNSAFDVVNTLIQARRQGIDLRRKDELSTPKPAVERAVPQILPSKQMAQQLDPEKARAAVEFFLNCKMKLGEQTFTFQECCAAVLKRHLDNNRYRWHDADLLVTNQDQPKWKQSVSSALSFFSNKEMVSFVHRLNLWMIIP